MFSTSNIMIPSTSNCSLYVCKFLEVFQAFYCKHNLNKLQVKCKKNTIIHQDLLP